MGRYWRSAVRHTADTRCSAASRVRSFRNRPADGRDCDDVCHGKWSGRDEIPVGEIPLVKPVAQDSARMTVLACTC